ncbi:hypothetical protein NBRC116492_31620 [Aurantivibrio infirmus]
MLNCAESWMQIGFQKNELGDKAICDLPVGGNAIVFLKNLQCCTKGRKFCREEFLALIILFTFRIEILVDKTE